MGCLSPAVLVIPAGLADYHVISQWSGAAPLQPYVVTTMHGHAVLSGPEISAPLNSRSRIVQQRVLLGTCMQEPIRREEGDAFWALCDSQGSAGLQHSDRCAQTPSTPWRRMTTLMPIAACPGASRAPMTPRTSGHGYDAHLAGSSMFVVHSPISGPGVLPCV